MPKKGGVGLFTDLKGRGHGEKGGGGFEDGFGVGGGGG